MKFFRNISDKNTDDELILRFRRTGDASILASLYSRYMELVYAVCLKYLNDQEPSKDAVMEIYQELLTKLPKHEVSNFRSWLYTVARNHCLMKLRRQTNIVNIDDDRMQLNNNLHHDGEDAEIREQQFVILSECLQKLPGEQRRVIDLFYLQQHCYNEVAKVTGFEWNKVRSLVQNGRRNLKICMEKTRSTRAEKSGGNG